jgi:hypothetical protein
MANGEAGEWVVTVHPDQRVLEVIYPARPTAEASDRYSAALKEAVAKLGSGPFDAVVDQRAMPILSAEISERMSLLLGWVHQHGLRRMMRIVRRSAIAELQAKRIVRDAGLEEDRQVLFHSREDAWAAVQGTKGPHGSKGTRSRSP